MCKIRLIDELLQKIGLFLAFNNRDSYKTFGTTSQLKMELEKDIVLIWNMNYPMNW